MASDSLSSKAIRYFTDAANGFSHVDAVMPDGSLLGARDDAVGGKPPGVWIRPQGYERWTRRVVLTLAVPTPVAAAWIRVLVAQLGKPYDDDAILGFVLGRVWHGKGKWICSALQTHGLRAAGYMTHLIVEPQQVSPNGLALAFSAIGAV